MKPTLTFQDITFSNGTTVNLDRNDIVVFVGPNNAGKSRALVELEQQIKQQGAYKVILKTRVLQMGSAEDVRVAITKNSKMSGGNYHGYRFAVQPSIFDQWSQSTNRPQIAPFFCTRVATETRITSSNPPPNIDILKQAPQHPIHVLQENDEVESKLSAYFRRAFGEDLFVYRNAGNKVPLFVGQKPPLRGSEDRLSHAYYERMVETMIPLDEQGDGMRSFTSVLLEISTFDFRSIILLDEPEAFLHPPQARLLGEFIAKEKHADSQLFIATHSSDILQGLMAGSSSNLRIIRIQREGEKNRIKELSKTDTASISSDSLLKYSDVLQGIFHKHVFICESDSDCLFYNTILNVSSVRGESQPDALFIHGNGKDRMKQLATALLSLDVPVSVIADLDLINNEEAFKSLFEALTGSWASIEGSWKTVKNAIESRNKPMTSDEVIRALNEVVKGIPNQNGFPKDKKREIDDIFRSLSPWAVLKETGRNYVPPGAPTEQFGMILDSCRAVGLYILEVGELEGFCRSVGGHGPAWVQRVLETRNLETDAELDAARQFMRGIWNARSVKK